MGEGTEVLEGRFSTVAKSLEAGSQTGKDWRLCPGSGSLGPFMPHWLRLIGHGGPSMFIMRLKRDPLPCFGLARTIRGVGIVPGVG